ncbi:hypothetical protein TNIN_325241 [Trichonephila inaurata madagascariensis]|uniref:Uncharacterized protein n=1 Tax=Trichonephila inaurata madagascariensis TaxID=2747483 RepID=A0A8X6XWV8_9ARAC|nr:hypothetical protein TNIN_325241 [Trichonephila inaurata madagascariensis]
MGKTDAGESTDKNSVMSFHVNDKISGLMATRYTGILGTQERKGTRQELERARRRTFQTEFKKWIDGRYVVSLHGLQGHPPFPQRGRNLAERRLKIVLNFPFEEDRKLGKQNEGVFSEWLQEGVIEEVKELFRTKKGPLFTSWGSN